MEYFTVIVSGDHLGESKSALNLNRELGIVQGLSSSLRVGHQLLKNARQRAWKDEIISQTTHLRVRPLETVLDNCSEDLQSLVIINAEYIARERV